MTDFCTLTNEDFLKIARSDEPAENADLSDMDWTNCDLPGLILRQCRIKDADFSQSRLEDLRAEKCQFLDCTFRAANLNQCHFDGCSFVNKETHQGSTFHFCEIKNATFDDCDFSFTTFYRCDLYDLAVKDCRFRGADLSDSTFCRILSKTRPLNRLEIKTSSFERANLRGLDLGSMQAEQSNFSYALMDECDLTGALMMECDLTNADLLSAVLTNTNLSGSNLEGVDLRQLKSYSGLIIMEGQQKQLLKEMGVDVI